MELQAIRQLLQELVSLQSGQAMESARAQKVAADPILALAEAAQTSGHHPQTLRQAARARELEVIRDGPRGNIRIRLSALNRWLDRQTVRARRGA